MLLLKIGADIKISSRILFSIILDESFLTRNIFPLLKATIRTAVKNEGVDINTIDSKKGWVKDYADKHLLSIQLTPDNDNEVACPKCKITYHPT